MRYRWWHHPLRCPKCRKRIERPYFVRESLFSGCAHCSTALYLKYIPVHEYWEVHDLQLDEETPVASLAGIKICRRSLFASVAACLSVLAVAGFLWAGLAGQDDKSQRIVPIDVKPGLFIQCDNCQEPLRSVPQAQAVAFMRQPKGACPFCGSKDLSIKARCPRCDLIFDAALNADDPTTQPACQIEAVCHCCHYRLGDGDMK